MNIGWKVKIPDIGTLATVVQSGKQMVKLELDGEQFWMSVELLEIMEKKCSDKKKC